MNWLSLLAFVSGAAIAVQMALNAKLGTLLGSPILASICAFTAAACFSTFALLITLREGPSLDQIKAVPFHLWYIGGLLSALAIASFYFLIPKMGLGAMVSFALSGQLVAAVVCGHFGWADVPSNPINLQRIGGLICLIAGLMLIHYER
ncbi:DMT family transporter [Gilvimarinus sp. SDUM040013]|uniref:DMT family transporter n=1 Tax=Gilvimarinus gilvus TaxID=3058038 RepID=A0ABU4RX60_9GAMM|nr:DMT family transporter [Gilvimarinus sp. SDUM040013]MDO3386636.1 DMT family transporter [Gilvimarinus sp. SDUM040013]MDX6849477.1 DMT family transporter [Gilvimarinus sp. SDUM040013]